ncbi:MAG: glutamate--tRNA ligase [Alphaproteobacteria bacterium]|nr:glutamate--tRNA ligase [Alphaproteobacteria bacterium]
MATTTNTNSPVVVRFAPSPTGYLHIGGARTALFNWLYAKANGGRFLLRIEDTDRERNSPQAVEAILEGLRWLGLDWDGEPVSQYQRADRHREIAHELLSQNKAYRCYLTSDELAAMRQAAEDEKRPFKLRSPWRDRDPGDAPADAPHTIRLRAPKEGETVINDHVQGEVTFANKDLDDLIILRSDGSPTYNLAVVVDDHDMGITHVIRGVDHLTNAARQAQIYQLLKWQTPQWAHVPLIHGPDGAKLSKRHGALGAETYRDMGYLPVAMRNYLVRLGWSHGDDEIFSTDDLIKWFDIDAINKSPARFDMQKLDAINGHWIRATPDDDLYDALVHLLPHLPHGDQVGKALSAGHGPELRALVPAMKERSKTLLDFLSGAAFLWADRPLEYDDKAAKLLAPPTRQMLSRLLPHLQHLPDWSADQLEATVREFAETESLKLGKVAQPIRAALTGTTVSPPIFDVMAVMGEEETIARLRDASA